MSSRTYNLTVKFDWDFDDTFTDESDYVISVNVDRSISGIGKPFTSGGGKVDRAQIELDNSSGRFSSKLSASALYSYIANGGMYMVPVTIDLSINGGSNFRIFTGVCSLPVESGQSINRARILTLVCLSNEEKFRNSRVSLPIDKAYVWLDEQPNESEAISYLLSLVSLSGTIDSGYITVLPLLDNESVLEAIWRVSKIAGGYFYSDVDGNYIYRNMSSFVDYTSSANITKSNSSIRLMSYDDINVSKKVVVKGQTLNKAAESTIYTNNSVIIIPKDDSVTITFEFSNYCFNVSGYHWQLVTTLGGTDIASDLSLSYTNYIDRSEVTFTNVNTTNSMVITGFYITGYEITQTDFEVMKESSDTFWDDRVGNELETRLTDRYIVSSQSADVLASMILARQELPLPTFQIVDFVYSSQIELLEVFTIQDDTLSDSDEPIVITRINYRISNESGCRLTVEGVSLSTLYPYITSTGINGYFIIGTNELGSSATNKARIFY